MYVHEIQKIGIGTVVIIQIVVQQARFLRSVDKHDFAVILFHVRKDNIQKLAVIKLHSAQLENHQRICFDIFVKSCKLKQSVVGDYAEKMKFIDILNG